MSENQAFEEAVSENQLEQAEGTEESAQETTDDSSLTADKVSAMLDERMSDVFDKVDIEWQRRMDRRATKLEERVQKQLYAADNLMANLKTQGVQVPEEAVKAVRQQVVDEAYRQPADTDNSSQNGNVASAADAAYYQQITAAGTAMMENFGLQDSDPEFETVKTDGSPQEYYQSIAEAGQARTIRLAEVQERKTPAQASIPGTSGQRAVGNAPPSNPYSVNLDSLYAQANSKSRKTYGT
jgi:hypothetical protein